ncbi:MAG: PDZ domain-containing protein [Myxococcota bacterium]
MRILKSSVQLAASATLSAGMFASMLVLLGWSPSFERPPVEFEELDSYEAVYQVDVDAAVDALAAAEAPAPEPAEITPVAAPEPAPVVDPGADPDRVREILAGQKRARSSIPRPSKKMAAARDARLQREAEEALASDGEGRNKRRRRRPCVDGVDSIQAMGGDRYTVERDLVDYYSRDLKEAARLAYVHWHRQDGEIVGFRVRRIRCGSVLHQAGFRNGDVIHSINGKPVTSIPQALMAYRKLRRKKRLQVDVTRRDGSSVQLRYRLT